MHLIDLAKTMTDTAHTYSEYAEHSRQLHALTDTP